MAEPFDRPDLSDAADRPGRPRLRRSRHERVLFGVCGGLAEYFGIDPTIVRVGFVLASLFPPTTALALLAYVVLTLLLPQEGNEHLGGRERLQHNLAGLREDVGGLTDTVRSGLRGSVPGRRPAGDELPTPVASDEAIERAAGTAGRREM